MLSFSSVCREQNRQREKQNVVLVLVVLIIVVIVAVTNNHWVFVIDIILINVYNQQKYENICREITKVLS